jgi:hypothetical protein
VPGYPVYYAPQLPENYFFYDGLYWVYVNDGWYASDWYNGPWSQVAPEVVPDFILRVPVRYYRVPPPYFHAWSAEAPPHWGEHWGPTWQHRRADWDRRTAAPPPAPLPTYQRAYSGGRYPSVDEQSRLHAEKYRYEPHEAVVREAYAAQREHRPAARNEPPSQRQQHAAEQRDQQQRQAAQQHDQEHKGSKSEAEQRPQATQQREPQRKETEPQQQRQAAQQQREQQQHRAAEQREQQSQASREKEAPPRKQPAPAPEQHARAPHEPAVQSADRSERGTPTPSHQHEQERHKNVDNSPSADDGSKGDHK